MRSIPIIHATKVRVPIINRYRNRVRNIRQEEPTEKKKGCGCGR